MRWRRKLPRRERVVKRFLLFPLTLMVDDRDQTKENDVERRWLETAYILQRQERGGFSEPAWYWRSVRWAEKHEHYIFQLLYKWFKVP